MSSSELILFQVNAVVNNLYALFFKQSPLLIFSSESKARERDVPSGAPLEKSVF